MTSETPDCKKGIKYVMDEEKIEKERDAEIGFSEETFQLFIFVLID